MFPYFIYKYAQCASTSTCYLCGCKLQSALLSASCLHWKVVSQNTQKWLFDSECETKIVEDVWANERMPKIKARKACHNDFFKVFLIFRWLTSHSFLGSKWLDKQTHSENSQTLLQSCWMVNVNSQTNRCHIHCSNHILHFIRDKRMQAWQGERVAVSGLYLDIQTCPRRKHSAFEKLWILNNEHWNVKLSCFRRLVKWPLVINYNCLNP